MSVDNRIPSEPYMELNGVTVYGIGRTPELNDLIYGKGVIDGQEH